MATCGFGLMNQPMNPTGNMNGMTNPANEIHARTRRRFWKSFTTPMIHTARMIASSGAATITSISTSRHTDARVSPYPIQVADLR